MKLTNALVQRLLMIITLVCVAVTVAGSALFAVFADFLARFPTDSF